MDAVRLVGTSRIACYGGRQGRRPCGCNDGWDRCNGVVGLAGSALFPFIHGKDITVLKRTEGPTFPDGNLSLDFAKFRPLPPLAQSGLPNQVQPVGASDQARSQANTSAEVEIASIPSGVEIQVNGKFVGNTPSTIANSTGDHAISVKRDGYKVWEKTITISGGKVLIAAELEADGGKVIQSDHFLDTYIGA